jgi:hypothetical protein
MAKKVRGARSNKPNDSFGTVNDKSLYRGQYREDVWADDEDNSTDEVQQEAKEETSKVVETEETSESFVETEKPVATADHDYKKRYDDLKRHYDQKLKEHAEEKKKLDEAMQVAQDSGISLPKSPEELDEFKTQYPDVYDVVQTIATMQAEKQAKELKSELEVIKSREKNLKVQSAYTELLNLHPDFNKIRKDEKFLNWLEEQPKSISDGIFKNNTDAKLASRVVDLYKVDMGISKKVESSQKSLSAIAVKSQKARDITSQGSDKKVWRASEIAKLKSWEFEKVEAEIDKARAEGRIDLAS